MDIPRSQAKRTKTEKFLQLMTEDGDPIFAGQPNDIVIPVMGATGSGKTTFVNSLLAEDQPRLVVGHALRSCTAMLHPVEITIPKDKYNFDLDPKDGPVRIIVVDTPGFDDTYIDDAEILRRISVWLASSYNQDMKLGGVIFLHDICSPRMSGTSLHSLKLFEKMVGHDAFKVVALGTTRWGKILDPEEGEGRQNQLLTNYWAELHEGGSRIFALRDMQESPRELIDAILQRVETRTTFFPFMKIQEEIVAQQKFIPETEAGKTLRYSLEQLIKIQQERMCRISELPGHAKDRDATRKEFAKGQQEILALLQTAKELKVPFSERIKRFFL